MSEENVNNEGQQEESGNEIDVGALQAQLDDMRSQLEAVNAKKNELLDEKKKVAAKAREEAEARERAELEKAKKNGDYEQLLKSSEKERETLSNQLNELRGKISSEKVLNESMKIASELADGANAELLAEFVTKRLKYTDEGIKVLDSSGDLTVSSIADLKNEIASSGRYDALLRGSKSSGGGASGGGNGSAGSLKITEEQWNNMSSSQQRDFALKGGSVE